MMPDPLDDGAPVASPAGAALDRRQRRALVLMATARVLGITVLLLIAYFAAPVGQNADLTGLVVLTVGLIGFVALLAYQIRAILDSPMPQLRAVEALATVVPVVVVVFALFYVASSSAEPAAFSEPITKVNGLYFTVTVLSTVGFGDITAVTDGPRIAVTVQMIVDLLIVGIVVKLILGASRIAVERRRAEADARVDGRPEVGDD
jgi:voltage-gated potassium channel